MTNREKLEKILELLGLEPDIYSLEDKEVDMALLDLRLAAQIWENLH